MSRNFFGSTYSGKNSQGFHRLFAKSKSGKMHLIACDEIDQKMLFEIEESSQPLSHNLNY